MINHKLSDTPQYCTNSQQELLITYELQMQNLNQLEQYCDIEGFKATLCDLLSVLRLVH